MHTEKEKEGGILDFLFGRGPLKKAAGSPNVTTPPPAPADKPMQSDHDYLRRQIEATKPVIAPPVNKKKPAEPPRDAIRTLGAPRKTKKK